MVAKHWSGQLTYRVCGIRTWLIAITVVAGGCARGCSDSSEHSAAAAQRTTAEQAPGAKPAQTVNKAAFPDKIGQELGLALPGRVTDSVLPGFSTFPRRVLPKFATDKALVVTVTASGLKALGHQLPAAKLEDADALRVFFRMLIDDWEKRAGVAANRVTLAFDRTIARAVAVNVRTAAHDAHSWRVVALAREEDRLMEILLDPPARRR